MYPYWDLNNQDSSNAEFVFGYLCHYGHGVPQDYVQAAQYYQRAVVHGHREAPNNLAVLYQQGLGVPKDAAKASEHDAHQWLTVRPNGSVRFTPLETPVIVNVALVGGGGTVWPPPPQPLAYSKPNSSAASADATTRPRGLPARPERRISIAAKIKSSANTKYDTGHAGARGIRSGGVSIALEVLLTVTTKA